MRVEIRGARICFEEGGILWALATGGDQTTTHRLELLEQVPQLLPLHRDVPLVSLVHQFNSVLYDVPRKCFGDSGGNHFYLGTLVEEHGFCGAEDHRGGVGVGEGGGEGLREED